jgi:hypothetical protein
MPAATGRGQEVPLRKLGLGSHEHFPVGSAYLLRVRIGAVRLIRGRSYLIRLTAVLAGGQRRAMTIRVRA